MWPDIFISRQMKIGLGLAKLGVLGNILCFRGPRVFVFKRPVTKSLNKSQAGVDLALIQTSMLFLIILCK